MRILGIDIGMKRTGLAMSDDMGISVKILPNLIARNRASALEKLLSLINEFSIKTIVIGLPEGRTPHSMAVARRALGLAEALRALSLEHDLKLQVILCDESYTSKTAQARMVKSGVTQKQRKIKLDGAAAAIMVEHFLVGQGMER
jgi:putative pre-16S rRNA nuclease